MNRIGFLRPGNYMLVGNLVANLLGLVVFLIIKDFAVAPTPDRVAPVILSIHLSYFGLATLVHMGVIPLYELPLRKFLNGAGANAKGEVSPTPACQKRLLNEPFFLLILDMGTWILAALFHVAALYFTMAPERSFLIRIFSQLLLVGVATTTVAFFILERILSTCLIPVFFPQGGLHKVPGTFRIKISTRLAALLLGINIIPLTAFFLMTLSAISSPQPADKLLGVFLKAVQFNAVGFLLIGILLVFLVTSSLTRPFSGILRQLARISKGEFTSKIPVSANDEIGYTSDVINDMSEGLQERELIKDAFGRYVSREIRDAVLSGGVSLDGEQKDVTVLFADLEGFTPMIETNDPKQSVKMMNQYFSHMAKAVQANNGLVLQFIGDEIYAVFGAPVPDPDHPAHGVNAALDMEKALLILNREFQTQGLPELSHRIGIHSGTALAAAMGSPDRMSYLLVGNTVNLASRLQGMNKRFGTRILMSGTTYKKLAPELRASAGCVPLGKVPVKGLQKEIELYASDGDPRQSL